ncbi:MFS transporter|uniref:MFS transporter n=1 Tax=Leuconostoc lactis TaxID=1246 RepID=A0A6L7ABY0_LEULA|nr:MFS transporter [Leuconostoc lactis]
MPLLKAEWTLNETQLGLVGAITSVGMMLGALLCGKLSDRFGRRRVLMWTLVLFSLSNLALAFAPNHAPVVQLKNISCLFNNASVQSP